MDPVFRAIVSTGQNVAYAAHTGRGKSPNKYAVIVCEKFNGQNYATCYMATDKVNRFRGKVIEILPNFECRVELDDGRTVRCYIAGKLKIARVHVLIGDEVQCVVPPNSDIGRIVFRYITKHWENNES